MQQKHVYLKAAQYLGLTLRGNDSWVAFVSQVVSLLRRGASEGDRSSVTFMRALSAPSQFVLCMRLARTEEALLKTTTQPETVVKTVVSTIIGAVRSIGLLIPRASRIMGVSVATYIVATATNAVDAAKVALSLASVKKDARIALKGAQKGLRGVLSLFRRSVAVVEEEQPRVAEDAPSKTEEESPSVDGDGK